jgi:hypothetical protein
VGGWGANVHDLSDPSVRRAYRRGLTLSPVCEVWQICLKQQLRNPCGRGVGGDEKGTKCLRIYNWATRKVTLIPTVEPEIRPLLAKGSETTFVSRQCPQKQTTEQRPLLGSRFLISNRAMVFSMRSVPRYNRDGLEQRVQCSVERSGCDEDSRRLVWNGREENSPPTGDQGNNTWIYASTPPYAYMV